MALVEWQEHVRRGDAGWWRPLLWVGSSALVGTVIAARQWRHVSRRDDALGQPWLWFALALRDLPWLAPAYVAATYALRHGVLALMGQSYRHEPWPQVFAYELPKYAVFYALFVAAVFGLRSHAALAAARWREAQQRALATQAQLTQLAQQIEPHFLFNALNTIAATVHSDPDLADALLTRLATLLRSATDLARQPEVPLRDELKLAEAYAAIMGQRFGDRVVLRFDVDPAATDCRVPSLVLQPLLENAFHHGVERRRETTHVTVRVACQADVLTLEVSDDAGVLPALPVDGVGLGNLRQRLQARHGDAAQLTLATRAGGGVVARMDLPCAGR
jgi:signal transduction histidine kinase